MSAGSNDIRSLACDWIAAWNARDLDRIMAHYSPDVEFQANTVVRRWNRPDGRLHGHAELREHFRLGLELAPALHFELLETFAAPGGYAVLYQRENGNRVLDVVQLDSQQRACHVQALYAAEQR